MHRFSIIIPAYNSADYIVNALNSIKSQSFKDYELIVVCDSCKDNTAEIAMQYGAKVHIVNFGNDGLTRSKGLDVANGEYVLFMDDDDWWLHEFVLEQIDNELKELNNPDILAFSFVFKGVCYASPTLNHGNLWIAVWNKCWKRTSIGDTRFPRVHSCSDKYFHEAMMKKNLRISVWDMPMYYYNYLREGSISKKDGATTWEIKQWLNT